MLVKHNNHRKPTKVPQMSYSGRLTCRGLLVKMQHKQHFFMQKLADIGKKTLPLQQNSIKNLPIMSYISVAQYASI